LEWCEKQAITAWNTRSTDGLVDALEDIKINSYPGNATKEQTLLNRIYRIAGEALAKHKERGVKT
jgi:hypothetical protein